MIFAVMRGYFVPTLVLVVLPALYLAWRLRLRSSWALRVGVAGLVAAVVVSLPWAGVDYLYLKRLNVFIAGATALVLLLRHLRVPWPLEPARYRGALAALAALAVVVYLNFFSFHGERTFIHLHDVAHYYLGSKYYAELGYTDLYTGMLRAEAELYDNHFKAIEARDLETYDLVHIRTLLQASDRVKQAFTPARWDEFRRDVAFFRQTLDQQYGRILVDHGFNPTPVWALIGGLLSRAVPGGSRTGILVLCLLDVALLAALFAAVGWAFGRTSLLLAVIYFCVVFGANFGWTGGAFLRYPWLFGVVVGIACLRRRRYGSAGGLLALAAALRIFPVFFLLPLALKAGAIAWRQRRVPRRYLALLGSFAATAGLLFALTGLLPRGWQHWREFRSNMVEHVENISPNVVGLTEVLAWRRGPEKVTRDQFHALKVRRQRIYGAQLVLVFLPVLVLVARLSRRQSEVGAAVLALPLLICGLSLASYYYVFLLLLVLARRRSPADLALIFAVESLSHALLLFEDREGLLYVYRSLAVLFLYLALWLDPIRRALRWPPSATHALSTP